MRYLLKRGANVSNRCFAAKSLVDPLRHNMVLHAVKHKQHAAASNEQCKGPPWST